MNPFLREFDLKLKQKCGRIDSNSIDEWLQSFFHFKHLREVSCRRKKCCSGTVCFVRYGWSSFWPAKIIRSNVQNEQRPWTNTLSMVTGHRSDLQKNNSAMLAVVNHIKLDSYLKLQISLAVSVAGCLLPVACCLLFVSVVVVVLVAV